jgi:ElaB/YqjD/DUF883 family membrane-anchored ribosome-binding protein
MTTRRPTGATAAGTTDSGITEASTAAAGAPDPATAAGTPPPPPSDDPDAIRADIERTREELGDSVEALAAKADVKARAQDKLAEARERARRAAQDATKRAKERVRHAAQDATERAKATAQQAGETVRQRPAPTAGVLAAVAAAVAAVVTTHRWRAAKVRAATRRRRQELGELLTVAAVQGAIFALVKVAVDRRGAQAVRKPTGTWPA